MDLIGITFRTNVFPADELLKHWQPIRMSPALKRACSFKAAGKINSAHTHNQQRLSYDGVDANIVYL